VALKEENITLRSELEGMQKRLESTERVLKLRQEQDQQLRENIAVARREVITHLDRRQSLALIIEIAGMQHNEPANLRLTSQVSIST
jgi:hypothetical protein